MLTTLVHRSRARGIPAVVLTFDPHPISLLRPSETPPQLTTLERRLDYIRACGVETTIVYPTDAQLLQMEPDAFFHEVVLDQIRAQVVVEGPNFFYGRNRAGNVSTLRDSCAAYGIQFEVVPSVTVEGEMVSSSAIRSLIQGGNVARAVQFLGRNYEVEGTVGRGAARGRTIGFPTANLTGISTLLPQEGVYAGIVPYQGRDWAAAINIGPNPTFGEMSRKFEAHLLDFNADLYDSVIRVEFVQKIRETRPFPHIDELLSQLHRDIEQVKSLTAHRTGTGPTQQ